MVRQAENINIIEWNDLNLKKFYCYGVLMSMSTRTLIYPTQLIKTRFQSQSLSNEKYKGFSDAVSRIYKTEGVRGLYKGLHLNFMQIPVSYVYLTVFEYTKEHLSNVAERLSASSSSQPTSQNSETTQHQPKTPTPTTNLILPYLISGFTASSLSQLVATPLDVIVQYKQVYHSSNMKKDANISGKSAFQIAKQLYKSDGIIRGFYRGFTISTLFFGVHSGLIWACYYYFLENIGGLFPKRAPTHSIKSSEKLATSGTNNSTSTSLDASSISTIILAGALSSLVTSMFLLPIDTIRTRHQLQLKRGKNTKVNASIWKTSETLINAEGYKGLYRGWQPRVVQSGLSGILFLAYEALKVYSSTSEI